MKKSDFIFWTILAIIALFYLLKGNDIHRDYYKHIEEQAKRHAAPHLPQNKEEQ